jgi:hypothetical protein
VLAEIAAVEIRNARDFEDRDDLTNLRVVGDALPYRHFAFTIPDRQVPNASGSSGTLRFVRVIPLSDEDKATLYDSGKLGTLADWYDRDPLMRVPRR